MSDVSTKPYRTFTVGLVQVDLWKKETVDGAYWVTVERKKNSATQVSSDPQLIESTDITTAIMALKQAHDYLKNPNTLSWAEEPKPFLQAPERLP